MKKAIALSALPLALLLGAAFQSDNSVLNHLTRIELQLSSLQAQVASLANQGPRKFYLTPATYDGAHALTACAAGYHMASLWEIHEPSNLIYNTELGLTTDDSGFGPPSGPARFGWIRTGSSSSNSAGPGAANCNVWTSTGSLEFGAVVYLPTDWSLAPKTVTPWVGDTLAACITPNRVWCVQD